MTQSRNEWVHARAHEIWEQEGRPQGQHDEHWRQAEAEYERRNAATAAVNTAQQGSSADVLPHRAAKASAGSTAKDLAETKRDLDKASAA